MTGEVDKSEFWKDSPRVRQAGVHRRSMRERKNALAEAPEERPMTCDSLELALSLEDLSPRLDP